MNKILGATAALVVMIGGLFAAASAQAAPCMVVTLTGTSGPPPYKDLAGPGTFVRYGDDSNDCGSVLMQFDAGRGTLIRLSQIGVQAAQLNAVFFTHIHSDHTEGFSDIVRCAGSSASLGVQSLTLSAALMRNPSLACL